MMFTEKRSFYRILLLVFIMILFSACSRVSDEEIKAARSAVQKGAIILDVRTVKEHREKHIEGSVNIPIQYLDRLYTRIPRDKEIVVYCRTGSRSSVAAEFLRKEGWKVYDVASQEDWERKIK